MNITKILGTGFAGLLMASGLAGIASPVRAAGTTVYPYCNPEAAPADPGIRADWQASCAKQAAAQAAAPPAPPAPINFPYCNPEAAPADPGIHARWQASCAAQQQQSQGATP
jgi:hypothetical protein